MQDFVFKSGERYEHGPKLLDASLMTIPIKKLQAMKSFKKWPNQQKRIVGTFKDYYRIRRQFQVNKFAYDTKVKKLDRKFNKSAQISIINCISQLF